MVAIALEEYYAAVYDALQTGRVMDIVWDHYNGFYVVQSGATGNWRRVTRCVQLDSFLPNDDIDSYSKESFVAMCLECYGLPQELEDWEQEESAQN